MFVAKPDMIIKVKRNAKGTPWTIILCEPNGEELGIGGAHYSLHPLFDTAIPYIEEYCKETEHEK